MNSQTYHNLYLVTSPKEPVQYLLESLSDIVTGTLYVDYLGESKIISSDFVSDNSRLRCHIEAESIIEHLMEPGKKMIEIPEQMGSWLFGFLDEKGD